MSYKSIAFLISILCFSSLTHAYPQFIGYGYSSCLTCHVNGHGSGPLNDYGRALWSAEIASQALYPKKMTDEDIANQSGFLGSVELPYWVRPHIKYRGLNLRRNVGHATQDTTKFYQMQADAGLTLQADPIGKYVAVITYGNVNPPDDYGSGTQGIKRILAKEYYVRVEAMKSWWIYAGLMDKVFGIRNIDHTSFQRTFQGFNNRNNSDEGIAQSLGVIVHKIEETWELSGNYFAGHPNDDEEYKQKGFSMMGEIDTGDKKRLGVSILSSRGDRLKKDLAAIHYRQALSKGSSLMFEYGFIQDEPTGFAKTNGSYNLLEGMVLLTRGYNFKVNIERYNKEFKASEPDTWKWAAGLLMFPAPRLELRAEIINMRSFSNQRAPDDSWAAQGQIHVSL